MTIRNRLAYQFLLLASFILGGAFLIVHALSEDYREEQFLGRLRDRGNNTAKLLLQVDEVDKELLAKIERNSAVRLPEESIHIFDHENREIFNLGAPISGPVDPAFLDSVRLTGEVRRIFSEREQLVFPFTDRAGRFVIIASGRDIYGRGKLRNQGRVMLATFLLGQVLIFLVGRFYAKRALSPVQRLIDDIRGIDVANLSRRVQAGAEEDEIAQLARSFNELLDQLQTSFLTQKNFIANASHELRNPLTAISGQLEVLLLKARSPEEYSTTSASVLQDMRALNRLADRLLMMAQVDNKAPAASFVPVRMDEVLWQSRSEVLRVDPTYAIEITMTGTEDESDLLVTGNETLLRSMMSNLMENACKYSDDHRARTHMYRKGNELLIEVRNSGMGIPPEDHDLVFEPFFRATNTGGAQGHGIGLSIARRIAELHGGRITLESGIGEGACFTTTLPILT